MKKNITLLAFLFFLVSAYSQVGINTVNPKATFHIDGAKDNPATGAISTSQQANDFVVTSAGNVGIGTISPSKKLEIISSVSPAFRIDDGSQQTGK